MGRRSLLQEQKDVDLFDLLVSRDQPPAAAEPKIKTASSSHSAQAFRQTPSLIMKPSSEFGPFDTWVCLVAALRLATH